MNKTFEATAMGDVIYFSAQNFKDATRQLEAMCGQMPSCIVRWRELDCLPEGEEYAADMR